MHSWRGFGRASSSVLIHHRFRIVEGAALLSCFRPSPQCSRPRSRRRGAMAMAHGSSGRRTARTVHGRRRACRCVVSIEGPPHLQVASSSLSLFKDPQQGGGRGPNRVLQAPSQSTQCLDRARSSLSPQLDPCPSKAGGHFIPPWC